MSEWAPRPPPEFVRDVMGNVFYLCVCKYNCSRHRNGRLFGREDIQYSNTLLLQ